jgi:hypothetical protein
VFLRTEMQGIAGAPHSAVRAPDPGHPVGSYLTEAAGSWTCSLSQELLDVAERQRVSHVDALREAIPYRAAISCSIAYAQNPLQVVLLKRIARCSAEGNATVPGP